jgi:hypothetical protein
VGFVSAHFKSHTIGKVFLGLVHRLPRENLHVTAIITHVGAGAASGGGAAVANDETTDAVSGGVHLTDPWTAAFRTHADRFLMLSNELPTARVQLEKLQLDVIVFADIGMSYFTYLLAFARVARVQVAFYGHPVTSGIASIDFYVSGDALEENGRGEEAEEAEEAEGAEEKAGKEGAGKDPAVLEMEMVGGKEVGGLDGRARESYREYSEQLVRFRGTGMYFPRPRTGEWDSTLPGEDNTLEKGTGGAGGAATDDRWSHTRSEHGLAPSDRVFVCPQQLQKLHPSMDALFLRILLRHPHDGVLVLLSPQQRPVVQAELEARLHASFKPVFLAEASAAGAAAGRTEAEVEALAEDRFRRQVRFVVLGRAHSDFMGLLLASDVMLDTHPFGGRCMM